VHQCVSEDIWMRSMLGISTSLPPLPPEETRLGFLAHYAACSAERAALLMDQPDAWFDEPTRFFDVERSHAWVLVRRFTHSAHHRGQLTVYLRLWAEPLYSTYGPTADTGGLFQNGARVIYRYQSIDDLLAQESHGGRATPLPGIGRHPVTERPGD
jgi:hypothetical protein